MKKAATLSVIVIVAVLVSAKPSDAWHGRWHHGPRVYAGPVWWGSPYWYYPRPYYVYSPPPPIVVEQPPVYVQQPAAAAPPPAPAAPAPQPPVTSQESYWYYCASANAYYPDAPTCPEPWIKVPPR